MDVNAIHQGFLRGARAQGAELRRNALVEGLMREGTAWRIRAGGDNILGKVVINAAGAWCDPIADLAGANRVGLVPKRRTAILFEGPEAHAFAQWPAIIDVDEAFMPAPKAVLSWVRRRMKPLWHHVMYSPMSLGIGPAGRAGWPGAGI